MIRYCEKRFDFCYIPSIDVETTKKSCMIKHEPYTIEFNVHQGSTYNLMNEDCFFIFYDVGDKNSFAFAKKIIQKANNFQRKKCFLIGNKIDLSRHAVNSNEVSSFCERYGCKSVNLSVKENFGISLLMNQCSVFFM